MRVLLTGAAGSLGRALAAGLNHDLIGVDVAPCPHELAGRFSQWESVDVTDPVVVEGVFDRHRPDAVVHLAGTPGELSLPEEITSHLTSTAALLDAMVAHEVRRLVYPSSNHAVGRTPRGEVTWLLDVAARPRPDTFYGVAKVAAEALCSLYADRYRMDTVLCRVGSLLDRPTTRRHLATWLSPADCVRMVEASLSTPSPGFAVLYGISGNTRGWWDLAPGRALGYHPEDDAEDFAAEILATPETETDRAECAVVGGPFAGREFERPALDRPTTPHLQESTSS